MAENRVLGVLDGHDMPLEQLLAWARSAEMVIVADGGANRLVDGGFIPQIIVGDLDSVRPEVLARIPDQRHDPGQDSTDCDKLLRVAGEVCGEAPLTLVGTEGDLPDHYLASLHSASKVRSMIRIGFRRGIGWVLKDGGTLQVTTKIGRRTSMVPITDCYGVDYEGVRWPLRVAKLHPQEATSISNEALRPTVFARVRRGACLFFLEYPPEEMPIW